MDGLQFTLLWENKACFLKLFHLHTSQFGCLTGTKRLCLVWHSGTLALVTCQFGCFIGTKRLCLSYGTVAQWNTGTCQFGCFIGTKMLCLPYGTVAHWHCGTLALVTCQFGCFIGTKQALKIGAQWDTLQSRLQPALDLAWGSSEDNIFHFCGTCHLSVWLLDWY